MTSNVILRRLLEVYDALDSAALPHAFGGAIAWPSMSASHERQRQRIPILTATDLMIFKMWFARRKDWADIEAMVQYGRADHFEAAAWIADLLGADDPHLATLQQIVTEVEMARAD